MLMIGVGVVGKNNWGLTGYRMVLLLWFTLEIAGCLVVTGVRAQASPYVPIMDPAYIELDALAAIGLVEVPSLLQRPYSRLAFGRLVRQARINLNSLGDTEDRFLETLARLEEKFSVEIALLCDDTGLPCGVADPTSVLREVRVDFTMASSPGRDMRTAYAQEDFIEGVVNPLLQRNSGRILLDGLTGGLESTLDIQLTSYVSAQLRPRAWVARPQGAAELGGATLLDGYLRGVFGGFGLEVGRNHLLRGRGRDAGPLLSNNSRGLDMVRLSSESPWRLPWLLRFLGPVTGAAWVADLGSDRFIPHSKLIGFELGARPTRYLEFGLSLLNHQGGEGAPEASWGDRLMDIFLVMPAGAEISDKILSADIILTFPNSGIELFASALSTDPDYQLSYRLAETWWDEAIWVTGLKWSGLGPDGRIDTWIEGHHAGVRPHTHHQFKDGLTVDDRVFGDPLGPLASSWQSGIAWTGAENILQVELFREVYSGDDWENAGDPFRWVRVKNNPDEIRFRIITNWTRNHEMSDLQTSVRFGYEHVTRFDFTDVNRSNYMAQVRFTWVPN
jgi:hypothetical protein